MNKILFRGKRKNNHEWVYGYVIQEPSGRTFIGIYMSGGMWDWVEVEAETVGPYIGLTDKNGANIFKGDIVSAHFKTNRSKQIFRVILRDGAFQFDNGHVIVGFVDLFRLEIIGNRWDNPELMGKE